MLLHHVASVFLILFSHMINYGNVGIIVSYLHDLSDIPVPITKAFNETTFKKTSIVAFVSVMVGWVVFRLYLFSSLIYYSSVG